MRRSTFGGKKRRTLNIEEDGVVLEVRPLEHTPQFRYVFLSVRSHCGDPLSVHLEFTLPLPLIHTLFVITDEYHLPQRRPILGQYRQVIPSLYLTRFVNDNGLYRDDLSESAIRDPVRRQHTDRAQDDSNSLHQTFVVDYRVLELPGFDHVVADGFV